MAAARTSNRGTVLVLLALAVLPGCTGAEAIESAHAVFMTRPGCPYFVANETRDSFAVLTPRDGFAPRQGDLLVGTLRGGVLPLAIVPFGAQEIDRTVPFEVVGHGLSLAEAQALYYGFCPLAPEPVAPVVPPVAAPPVAPDTTGF